MIVETERLRLRPWRAADKPAIRAIVNTPAMMEHFGGVAPVAEIDALIDAQIALHERDGFSMGAVELKDGTLAGICGIRHQTGYPDLKVHGVLEIGWRIGEAFWGQGIAREAARASIDWGFAHTDFPFILAWTSPGNARSWGLMHRLGMDRRPAYDFRHPKYAVDDPLGEMIVYGIGRPR